MKSDNCNVNALEYQINITPRVLIFEYFSPPPVILVWNPCLFMIPNIFLTHLYRKWRSQDKHSYIKISVIKYEDYLSKQFYGRTESTKKNLYQLMSKKYCWICRALSIKAILWENRKYEQNLLYYLLLITSTENNISPRTTKLSIVQTREITNQAIHIFVYTNWIFLF